MKEMTALEYFREKARMTKMDSLGDCDISCKDCPLSRDNNGKGVSCPELETLHSEKSISIVQKWSAAHPRRTILKDFLEKYPDAPLMDEGYPEICPHHLGYEEETCAEEFNQKCKECWNRPLEEVRKDDRKE